MPSKSKGKTKSQIVKAKKEVCCPLFHPEKWDKKEFDWKKKQFIKESVPALFHIPCFPLIGKKIMKMMKMAEEAKAVPSNKDDLLMLFYDPSAFKSEIYVSVTKKIDGANNAELSGKFIGRVFEGPYSAVPKSIKTVQAELAKSKKKALRYYVHYSYCPKCAKEYGNNYMVIFAQMK